MENRQEGKQKRKTPLTTIAISQEYAQKLDEYLGGKGITRKEFVELSVDYFQRTGFDLRGEVFDISPLEKVAGRLEKSAKIMEQHNEGTDAIRQLIQTAIDKMADYPSPGPLIGKIYEDQKAAENRVSELTEEIEQLQNEIKALQEYKVKASRELRRVRDEQPWFGRIEVKTVF